MAEANRFRSKIAVCIILMVMATYFIVMFWSNHNRDNTDLYEGRDTNKTGNHSLPTDKNTERNIFVWLKK